MPFFEQIMHRQPGILFSYGISNSHLYWLFLRVVPLWRIRLTEVYHVRRGSMLEFFSFDRRRILKPWMFWVWGTSFDCVLRRQTTRFLIETKGSSKILLRLKPEFHYVLRTRISAVRVKQQIPSPMQVEPRRRRNGSTHLYN